MLLITMKNSEDFKGLKGRTKWNKIIKATYKGLAVLEPLNIAVVTKPKGKYKNFTINFTEQAIESLFLQKLKQYETTKDIAAIRIN